MTNRKSHMGELAVSFGLSAPEDSDEKFYFLIAADYYFTAQDQPSFTREKSRLAMKGKRAYEKARKLRDNRVI